MRRDMQESDDLFDVLSRAAMDAIMCIDGESKILFLNRAAEKMFGYPAGEVLGQELTLLMPQRMRDAHRAAVKRHIRTGRKRIPWQAVELVGRRKGGKEIPLEVSFGEIVKGATRSWASPRDITDRKRTEEALRERDERLATTLNSIGDAVIVTNARGRVTFLNPVARTLTGWTQDEAAGKPLRQVFHIVSEETGEPVADPAQRVMREGAVVGLANHTVLIARDGVRRSIDDSGAPIRDANGRITGVVVVFHDVSENRRFEADLRKLSRAVEQSPTIVMMTDPSGKLEYVNPKFTEVTGDTPEEVAGKNPRLLKSGKTSADEYAGLWETITAGSEWSGELLNRRKNGDLYWVHASISPVRNTSGAITHFIGVQEDITERKRAEEERNQLFRERESLAHRLLHAEEEERRRVAYDLHDGPAQQIVAAHMYLESYRFGKTSTESQKIEGYLALATSYLNSAIEETRHIISSLRPHDLDDFGLAQALRHYLERTKARARCEVEFQTDMTDSRLDTAAEFALFRIAQEAANNALKHSGSNSLRVNLFRTPSEVTLEIKDRGHGFDLAKGWEGKSASGGVGLVAMRERAEMIGGALDIESVPGQGTTVRVQLPLREEAPARLRTPQKPRRR